MSTKHLTNVEAQRIIAILSELYSKIQLLSHVPPLRRVPDFESFQHEVGPEVAQVLDEQVLLEQQMQTMGAERCLAAGMQQLESAEQARLSCHARVSARARARV